MAILLVLLSALALLIPALVVARMPRVVPIEVAKVRPQRIVPKAELPPVEPVELVALAPEDARSFNAAIPFSSAPNPAARPFVIVGTDDDRNRAIDCLAAAVYYEAGDDTVGQRPVAQVILNRLRHPAFPKSICGVVFQGSERRTGCQFTFTCDGAMARTPSPAAWVRAREVAQAALTGTVDKAVGYATHYHTDWVVPYWSSSLDKIVEVHTHLFFRWAGWWGTPPAFNRRYLGAEPVVPQLARLSPVHAGGDPLAPMLDGALDPASVPGTGLPGAAAVAADPNTYLVRLDRKMAPDAYAVLAIRTCGERPFCKVMGWSDPRKVPTALPLTPAQLESMSFSYLRDQAQGYGKALWNCEEFKRPSPVQCMRRGPPKPTMLIEAPKLLEAARPPVVGTLSGVRRKGDPVAAPTPVPTATPMPPPVRR
jgi:spore germination cell wall hydrolase CwlJ-like protein